MTGTRHPAARTWWYILRSENHQTLSCVIPPLPLQTMSPHGKYFVLPDIQKIIDNGFIFHEKTCHGHTIGQRGSIALFSGPVAPPLPPPARPFIGGILVTWLIPICWGHRWWSQHPHQSIPGLWPVSVLVQQISDLGFYCFGRQNVILQEQLYRLASLAQTDTTVEN